jgi:mono/diheme cytochrome c family protein
MHSYNATCVSAGKGCVLTLLMGPLCALIASPPASANGTETFKTRCAMCHGPDAAGNTPMGKQFHIRDLRSAEVQKLSDNELTEVITNGKPPMPAFGKTLSTSEIHELVSYLRSMAKR